MCDSKYNNTDTEIMMPKDCFAAQTYVIFYQRVLISRAERMGEALVSALVCTLTMLILCVVCRRNEMHLLPGHSSSVCAHLGAPPHRRLSPGLNRLLVSLTRTLSRLTVALTDWDALHL